MSRSDIKIDSLSREVKQVLCLDLGKSHTGYAVMDRNNTLFAYGLLDLSKVKRNSLESGIEINRFIVDCASKFDLSHIAYENAFKQQGDAARAFNAMHTLMLLAAYESGLDLVPVASSSIKLIMAGHGHADKALVSDGVNKMFGLNLKCQAERHKKVDNEQYSSTDHNISDAIGAGVVAIMKLVTPELWAVRQLGKHKPKALLKAGAIKHLHERKEDHEKNFKTRKKIGIFKKKG